MVVLTNAVRAGCGGGRKRVMVESACAAVVVNARGVERWYTGRCACIHAVVAIHVREVER